jgi:hypothetical protein
MAFDTKGRLWVAVWPSYPHWKPKEELNDKLLILEDTDGDGKADKCTVFADHLNCPTGFEFYNGGVLVAQAPPPRLPLRFAFLDCHQSRETTGLPRSIVVTVWVRSRLSAGGINDCAGGVRSLRTWPRTFWSKRNSILPLGLCDDV